MAFYLSCTLITRLYEKHQYKPSRLVLLLSYILFTATYVHASQTYILSYRTEIKNAVVISQSYHYTQAMHNIKAHTGKSLTLNLSHKMPIKTILLTHKDEIIGFLMSLGVHTRSHEKIDKSVSSSLISLTIPPTYVTVDFNDDYAIITRLILD